MSFGLDLLSQRTKAVVVKRDYIDRPGAAFRAQVEPPCTAPPADLSVCCDIEGKHASPSLRRIVSQRNAAPTDPPWRRDLNYAFK